MPRKKSKRLLLEVAWIPKGSLNFPPFHVHVDGHGQAGCQLFFTAKYVADTAIRSTVECNPSETMPKLFVKIPVISFRLATTKEAKIDESAILSLGDVDYNLS